MDNICKIPIGATFTVYKGSSKPVMTSAEYVDIPADAIARFLVERCGVMLFSGVLPIEQGKE